MTDLTAPSPTCRRRRGRPCVGAQPADRRTAPRRAPRCCSRPSRTRPAELGVDVVELLARVPAREHADERRVRDDEIVRGDLRPRPARKAHREQPAVSAPSAPRRVLGERTADGVVDEVDPAPAGRVAQRRLERSVAVIDRSRRRRDLDRTRPAPRRSPPRRRARRAHGRVGPRRCRSHRPRRARRANRRGARPPRSTSPIHAVRCGIQKPAASASVRPLGDRRTPSRPRRDTPRRTSRVPSRTR